MAFAAQGGSRLAFLAALLALPVCASGAPPRPNVVFFYADDLGYGDLACYGSPVAETPHLDALARDGTRFTQFYVSHCVCSPTRCSAMTGHWPSRHRIYAHLAFFKNNRRRGMPDWLDVAAPSLPRALQRAGYRTAMIGKWHLGGGSGSTWRSDEVVINHPDAPAVSRYGFDHARITFGNGPTWRDAAVWPRPHEVYPYADEGWQRYSSRAIAEEAIGFLEDHVRHHAEQPFYVNVWFKDVHTPMRPTAAMRRPFLGLEEPAQTHYAMLRFMDEQIGRVLARLDKLGLRENTLVLFSSDNGAAKGRGGSNAPLRAWKWYLYEGGIRVPLVARWPGRVPQGRVDRDSVLNIVDLVPTLARLTGAEMPEGYEPDGVDATAALGGEPFERSAAQFWHHPTAPGGGPQLAVREGRWKLLTDPDGVRRELYNLEQDAEETTNRAAEQPEIAAALLEHVLRWHDSLAPAMPPSSKE